MDLETYLGRRYQPSDALGGPIEDFDEIDAASSQKKKKTITWRLGCLIALVSILAYSQYGYQVVVLNVTKKVIVEFINESFVDHYDYQPGYWTLYAFYAVANSGWDLGGMCGVLIALALVDRIGRKLSFVVFTPVIGILGAVLVLISYYTNAFEVLLLGRLITGVSAGLMNSITPIYVSELSPTSVRGLLIGWHSVIAYSWALLSECLGFESVLGTKYDWHFLLAISGIPMVILLVLSPLLPKSPAYMYIEKFESQQATSVVNKFYGSTSSEAAIALSNFETEFQISSSRLSFRAIWRNPALRRALLVAIAIGCSQSVTGQAIISHYSTSMFEAADIPYSLAQRLSVIPIIVVILVGLPIPYLLDRLGRRPLMLAALSGQLVAACVITIFGGLAFFNVANWMMCGIICVIAVVVSSASYATGPGPMSWVMGAELSPLSARAGIVTMAAAFNFGSAFIEGIIFPFMNEAIGLVSVLPLAAIPALIILLYLYFEMPETRLKTPVKVYEDLALKTGAPLPHKAQLYNQGAPMIF